MLEWLTSFPGILISCGVLLLIISVVLFIVTCKKNGNEEINTVKEEKPEVKVEEPVVETPGVQTTEEIVEVPVEVEETTIEVEIPEVEDTKSTLDLSFEKEPTVEEVKTSAYGGYNPLDSIKRNIVTQEESVEKTDTLDE